MRFEYGDVNENKARTRYDFDAFEINVLAPIITNTFDSARRVSSNYTSSILNAHTFQNADE